jgi:hypothetical protein
MTQNISRRNLLKSAAALPIAAQLAGCAALSSNNLCQPQNDPLAWAYLLHLSTNMWEDRIADPKHSRGYRHYMRFNENLYNDILKKMHNRKLNMLVLDLGNAVVYKSHPEIAVKNAWSRQKLRSEIKKMRDLGIEPIPKLNFSAGHDAWLCHYRRETSTDVYYKVCADLIAEVADLFDNPRYFHLGMDEETTAWRKKYNFLVFRQHDLWWEDINVYFKHVKKAGSKPWVWSDYMWRGDNLQTFLKKMPRDIMQSNWYYADEFDEKAKGLNKTRVQAYRVLSDEGFDQIPCGSNYKTNENFHNTVEFCKNNVDPKQLKGFLMAPWHFTFETERKFLLDAVDQVADAKEKFYS